MKKLVAILFTTVFISASYAGNNIPEAPKAMNYKQILSQIEYPQVCREKGIEGKVIVMLRISAQGDILEYDFKSAPCSDLQDAVEASLPGMKFKPATDENGRAVDGILALPVNFKLTI